MGVASDERQQLCDLFEQVGPDASTLCEGWQTRDLAVHLLLRERRPDALAGRFFAKLQDRSERVEGELRERSWPDLVSAVREGAPKWNPLSYGSVDEAVNSVEFYVHHEDVRRARDGWRARPSTPEREDALWKALTKLARVVYGRSPVGVVLRRPDGTEIAGKRGPRTVRIEGQPSELVLHALGRRVAQVGFEGNQADLIAVEDLRRSI